MKALEKDRNRRYQTANGLAMDVQRYLNNEPVMARPPSRLYRFQKLVRRNRAVFISVAAVSLALIAGFGTSTWLFFKERDARREAQRGREAEALLRRKAEAREMIAQAVSSDRKETNSTKQTGWSAPFLLRTQQTLAWRYFVLWGTGGGSKRQLAACGGVLFSCRAAGPFEESEISFKDYTQYAVVLAELGDRRAYENFCRESIKHLPLHWRPVIAERILKNSLLLFPARLAGQSYTIRSLALSIRSD